jgi:hypothetical protein
VIIRVTGTGGVKKPVFAVIHVESIHQSAKKWKVKG